MRLKELLVVIGLLVGLLGTSARGDLITYDLTGSGGAFDFEASSGIFTDTSGGLTNGLQITVTAFVVGGSGVVNGDGNGLGVNEDRTGDVSAFLDGGNGNESLVFGFNDLPVLASLRLTEISLASFTSEGNDAGMLTIQGQSASLQSLSGTVVPAHSNLEGGSFTVAFTGGNGFAVRSLTFEATAVPETSTIAFAAIGAVGGVIQLRRRKAAKG